MTTTRRSTHPAHSPRAGIARRTLRAAASTLLGLGLLGSTAGIPTATAQVSSLTDAVPAPAGSAPSSSPLGSLPAPAMGAPVLSSDQLAARVPERTSTALVTPAGLVGTPNAYEPRPALSLAKLYLVDYALRHGDRSVEDFAMAERMIRWSDDYAATVIDRKYPGAINAIAAELGLTSTFATGAWGQSMTSAADVAQFVYRLNQRPGRSFIRQWMSQAAPVADDGTHQNWGTARLPFVDGTKWGWSDQGRRAVASASSGPGFAIAAMTWGEPWDQDHDLSLGGVIPLQPAHR